MFNLIKDIENASKKFPNLTRGTYKGKISLEGSFVACDSISGIVIETYQIVILFPESYPYSFPIVIETSNKIPKISDRHVNSNGTLCFSNPLDEAKICQKGIDLNWFLENILNPHLCREYVREKDKLYPTGERSHGFEGLWEGYYELFSTSNKSDILNQLEQILNHEKIGRNTQCYCGSKKKYKRCHEEIERAILAIGKNKAIEFYETLKKNYNK